jgi:hypothetical protein
MNNRARVIKTDSSVEELDHQPTLKEAQGIVGGYVELVKAREDASDKSVVLAVNEDGRAMNLTRNFKATLDYSINTRHFPLVGNVVVLYGWKTLA